MPAMDAARNDRALAGFMLSASIASTIGGLPFNALPVLLGSLADAFALDAASAGLMGSLCFAGYLLGTLGAPLWIDRLDWRALTVAGAAGSAASFALSAQVTEVRWLYGIWALVGFFASTMTCLGMRVLAELPGKERAYGVRLGVELSVTAAVLFALPPLVIAHWKYPGAALALAAVVALLGLSACWVPRRSTAATQQVHSRGRLPMPAWGALAMFFLFLVGNIGLWAFLERIGSALKIVPAEMGLVFAVLKLLGGAAAFAVALVGERLARSSWWLVTLFIGTGLALLAGAGGFLSFALGTWLWEFGFTCGCVFQTARIARSDASGRAVVLVPAVFACSSMVGPALAGHLASGGFTPLLALAAASSLVPLLVHALRRQAAAVPQPRRA